MEDVAVAAPVRRTEEAPPVAAGGGKRKTMLLQEADVVLPKEGNVTKKETPAPKPRRKRGEPAEDGAEGGRRRRKPKPTVEVNSTFTELRRLLQEMRPSTLQVLRTPYYRNCKAARNMRKGVRQIRDFCKQVRLETVMLAKKKQGEEITSRRKRKPDATPPLDANKTGADVEPGSPSHSTDVPSQSNEKRTAQAFREPSESSEPPKPKILSPKAEVSPVHKERERERSPKRDRDKLKSPKKEREREKSPKRERERDKSPRREREKDRSPKREKDREKDRSPKLEREREREKSPRREKERERDREREKSPRREKERDREREKSPKREKEREKSPKREREREKSPKREREKEKSPKRELDKEWGPLPNPIQKKPKMEVEPEEKDMMIETEESE